MTRELTGRHVAAIFGLGFGTIIAVNLTLAAQAVRTFPGLETRNAYVASQSFDAERAAQEALGWEVEATGQGGRLTLAIHGAETLPPPEEVSLRLGRRTFSAEDRELVLTATRDGYVADIADVAPGAWALWIALPAPDGTVFRQRLDLRVAP